MARCGTAVRRATKIVPSAMLSWAIGVALSLLATTCSGQKYVTIAPIDTTLPASAPPFEHSTYHPLLPKNVSVNLDTRPARLQTNGFYANWLVSLKKQQWQPQSGVHECVRNYYYQYEVLRKRQSCTRHCFTAQPRRTGEGTYATGVAAIHWGRGGRFLLFCEIIGRTLCAFI